MRSLFSKTIVTFVVLLSLTEIPCGAADKLAAGPKGVLKGAIHFSPSADWLDPSQPSFGGSGLLWLYLFHDALLKPMPEGLQTPCLAESWNISPDYRIFEFKLRRGVRFHNGDEMTAEDVVFSISRYKGVAAKQIKDRIEKVEAVNPYLVRVSFKTPFPNFFEYFTAECTIGWVVPKKHIEKVGDAEYRKNPIGCGPYKLMEFKPDMRIVGEAFENFWRKVPNIRRMEFYVVKELSSRYAMLKRGEVDMALNMLDVFYDRVKKDPELRLLVPESPTRLIVNMSGQWDPKSPWSDPRVRKAASLAIDRQTLADVHIPGCIPVGEQLSLIGEPEGVSFPPDPYDPERAKKLLAEAGYPKGFHGGIYYPWNSHLWPLSEQVANYWKAIGITMDSVLLDRVAHLSKRRSGQMRGATFIESYGHPTIGTRLEYLFGGITGGGSYGNYPDIQELWEKYNKAFDPKIRKDLIGQIQRLMHDRTMIIVLTTFNAPTGFGSKVKGNPYGIQRPFPIWFTAPFEDIELN